MIFKHPGCFILVFSFCILVGMHTVSADSDGVWHQAEDVREGTFGSDEAGKASYYRFDTLLYLQTMLLNETSSSSMSCTADREGMIIYDSYLQQFLGCTEEGWQNFNIGSIYEWETGTWSTCSTSCGSGTRTRDVTCVDKRTGDSVDDSNCDASEQPSSTKTCNSGYSYDWNVGGWSTCSASHGCGYGSQYRSVSCERCDGTPVSDSYCAGSEPDSSQSCYAGSDCGGGTCSLYYCEAEGYYTCGGTSACPSTWSFWGAGGDGGCSKGSTIVTSTDSNGLMTSFTCRY